MMADLKNRNLFHSLNAIRGGVRKHS
jgi:hypothetical protein